LRTGAGTRLFFEDTMRIKFLAWMLLTFLLFAIPSWPQAQNPRPPINGTADPAGEDEGRERLTRDMAKKANLERQAMLKSDTEKLVKLSGELKDYVNKSNENILSLDVLKKAEEIEKLAHSVKERMKGSY
jgi:hypothetical protein